MLVHLRMQNIALIDDVSMDFGSGLNILTGETGAGKSILLDGINLALGNRAQKELFRNGKEPAQVDLLFYEDNPHILDLIRAYVDFDDPEDSGQEILLTRRFGNNGRSVCRINGQIVTASQMKEAAHFLIDVHGQHEHQSLLDASRHRELLDRFDEKIAVYMQEYQDGLYELREVQEELDRYTQDEQEKERRLSLMYYEKREIEDADLKEGEEEELMTLRKRLYGTERLQRSAGEAYQVLSADSMDQSGAHQSGALEQISQAINALHQILDMDAAILEPIVNSLEEMSAIGEDLSYQLRDYVDSLEADPERLGEIEERISQIRKLKSKYGDSVAKIQAYYEHLEVEIGKLENIQETRERLMSQKLNLEKKLKKSAGQIHELRVKAASEIEQDITSILATLQFNDPLFKVQVTPVDHFLSYGMDEIQFMIRTNVGDAIQPLNRIASGGEMSRIMLAIKTVLARKDEISTLIFDEIDTGISGRTAQSVAERMCQIAAFHQVICITHLPQIAAMADTHFCIEKKVTMDHTRTFIQVLNRTQMIEELARLLGGVSITDSVRSGAAEMKNQADDIKKTFQIGG